MLSHVNIYNHRNVNVIAHYVILLFFNKFVAFTCIEMFFSFSALAFQSYMLYFIDVSISLKICKSIFIFSFMLVLLNKRKLDLNSNYVNRSYFGTIYFNKKVLLRDRKRCTTHAPASRFAYASRF